MGENNCVAMKQLVQIFFISQRHAEQFVGGDSSTLWDLEELNILEIPDILKVCWKRFSECICFFFHGQV